MSDATFKMDGQFIGTENMEEEVNKFYIELPGDKPVGTFGQRNEVILQKHRNVFVYIEDSEACCFTLRTEENISFYSLKYKQQFTEYTFSSGEEVELWFRKSYQGTFSIEAKTPTGKKIVLRESVARLDPNSYDDNNELPAPIVFTYKSTSGEATNIPDTLMSSHISPRMETMPSHKYTSISSSEQISVAHKWQNNALTNTCHEMQREQQVIYDFALEIPPYLAERYKYAIKDGFQDIFLIADGDITTLGLAVIEEYLGKRDFLKDLRGCKYRVEIKNGKNFIIFSGRQGLRSLVTAARYGTQSGNKIAPITIGFGTLADTSARARGGVRSLIQPGLGRRLLLIGLAVDTCEWIASGDEDSNKLIASLVNTCLVGAATFFLVPYVAMVAAPIFAIGAMPATLLIVGSIAIGIGVAFVVDKAFELLGIKEFIYRCFSIITEYEKKSMARDPDWVPWWM